jgi:hypothetical protein
MVKVKQGNNVKAPNNKIQDRLIRKLVFKVLAFQSKLCSLLESKTGKLSIKERKHAFYMFCFISFPLSVYLIISGFGAHEMYKSYRESIKAPVLVNDDRLRRAGNSNVKSLPPLMQRIDSNAFIDSLVKARFQQSVYDSVNVHSERKRKNNNH